MDKIKTYGHDSSPENRHTIVASTIPLQDATTSLLAFSSSPEFASIPPIISDQAKISQKPILQSGSFMLEGGTEMISQLKLLIQNPQNRQGWNSLTASSRKVWVKYFLWK